MIEAIATYFAQNGADWLQMVAEHLAISATALLAACAQHLQLLGVTMIASCALACVLTLACLKFKRLGDAAVELMGAFYSIPSLALFALLIPWTGLGFTTAVIVMVAYNQFMLVRNALEGLRGVDASVLEAARGMGMSETQVLLTVSLPLAMPAVLAGLRLACVSTVGIATVAAAINAGGLGAVLFSGLRTMNIDKILGGTICCAALALTFDAVLGAAARACEKRLHIEG